MGRNRKGCVAGTSIHKEKQKHSSPTKFNVGTLMALKSGGPEEAQTFAREHTLMGKLFNRGDTDTPSMTPTGPTDMPTDTTGMLTDPVTSPMNKGQAIEYANYMTRGKRKI